MQVIRVNVFLSNPYTFYFFLCLTIQARISTTLNRNTDSNHPYAVPNLKAFNILPLSMVFAVGFWFLK